MEAKDRLIVDFVGKKDDTFLIPSYQRKYKWTFKKEVKELVDDLEEFIKNGKTDYFLGSIVVKTSSGLDREYTLVDGQQRITTFLLMIAAIYQVIKNHQTQFKFRILSLLETEEAKFKLKRLNDEIIVQKIVKDQIETMTKTEKASNYFEVFNFLHGHFKNMELEKIEDFYYKGIEKINLAIINLNIDEDEFLVFESINSKGQSLSPTDLIKNYIMMQVVDNLKLESFFENNFLPLFEGKELEDFYRQFLALKTGALFAKSGKNLYYAFKNNWARTEIDQVFFDNIHQAAQIWRYIKDTKFSHKTYPLIKGQLINYYTIIHTLVMKNSDYIDNKLIVGSQNKQNIEKGMVKLSSVIIKRMLFGRGRVESNRSFAKIGHDFFINKFQNIDQVISHLEKASGNIKTPTWDEINNQLDKVQLYSNYKNTLKWTFIALEEEKVKKEISTENITIEHIYPQNPSLDWKLDHFEREEMDSLLHTLGNLSITNDNSALGNAIFQYKKEILSDKSYLKINKSIYEAEKWDFEAIKERAQKLLTDIKITWN